MIFARIVIFRKVYKYFKKKIFRINWVNYATNIMFYCVIKFRTRISSFCKKCTHVDNFVSLVRVSQE